MFRFVQIAGAVFGILFLTISAAFADDWIATKLRGTVLQLVDGEWISLARNDVVPDDRAIRTGVTGRVTFQRGEETIELGARTQIRILDRQGQRFTTVEQAYGTVAIEAEALSVKHFEVTTPFLAAVVKGTKFVVSSDASGASVVVTRGKVDVRDKKLGGHEVLLAGEAAIVDNGAEMTVIGTTAGRELTNAEIKALQKLTKAAEKASEKAAKKAAKAAEKAAKEAAKEAKKNAKAAKPKTPTS